MILTSRTKFERKFGVKLIEVVGHITEIDGLNVYADLLVVYKKFGRERDQDFLVRMPLRSFRNVDLCVGRIFKLEKGKVVQTPCKPHVRRMIYARGKNRARDLEF